jgi:exopolysaccharide biosynthesis polyprenyl glycosylphosphotransferase
LTAPVPGLVSPPLPASLATRSEIEHRLYARRLFVGDLLVVGAVVIAGDLVRLVGRTPIDLKLFSADVLNYPAAAVILAGLWMLTLSLSGSRSRRVVCRGIEEYAIILLATLQLFGLIAIAALMFDVELSRLYLAVVLPLGAVGLMINRNFWRRVENNKRRRGDSPTAVLVVGTEQVARDIADTLMKDPATGYQVVGICTPQGCEQNKPPIKICDRDVPIVGPDAAIVDAALRTGVSSVALTATDHLRPTEIRRLIWELDAIGVDLMVVPGLIDVATQRLHSREVAGMAMLEVSKPQYNRANSMAKRTFDVVFGVLGLIAVTPLMILAAIAVKLSSSGPVFYASERIGLNGATFKMYKFRTMYDGADGRATELIAANGGNPLFFKVKNDPRITPVGRLLRKFSVDELPQIFNVLMGEMSIVGPRPQVRREVESYDDLVRRRLAVKPGLTGLWQVSGRSNLKIDDAIRLDLSYVENWSLVQDLVIIARTAKAVLRGEGAY